MGGGWEDGAIIRTLFASGGASACALRLCVVRFSVTLGTVKCAESVLLSRLLYAES